MGTKTSPPDSDCGQRRGLDGIGSSVGRSLLVEDKGGS